MSAIDHVAQTFYAMQQVVQGVAAQGGDSNPARIFGGIVAEHWLATRKELGLAGKWATLEETKAAFAAKLGGGVAAGVPGMSGALDFDMVQWDGASAMCTVCASDDPRGASGACSHCGNTGP